MAEEKDKKSNIDKKSNTTKTKSTTTAKKATTTKKTTTNKEKVTNNAEAKNNAPQKEIKTKNSTSTQRTTKSSKKSNSVKSTNKVSNKTSTTKTTTKSNNTTRKAPSTKNTKKIDKAKETKKAQKTDGKIKQIIAEQLEKVDKIEEIKNIPIKEGKKEKANVIDEAKIAQQIETAKKMPKNEKKQIRKNIVSNILLGIFIALYFGCLTLAFINVEETAYITDLKSFSVAILTITIILFEYAYNKDDGKIAIKGIELLCVAIITLILLYIYILYQEKYLLITYTCIGITTIYYIVKSILIYIREKSKWKKTISDVKEIIAEE